MHWNIQTTSAKNRPLHVSALQRCRPQEAFTLVKVVISKWSVVCIIITHLHTYENFN
jgi:hypothetical protein